MFSRFTSVGVLLASALAIGTVLSTTAPPQGAAPAQGLRVAPGAYLQGTAEFSAAGTYTWIAPQGVRSVWVELWGAGGGGSRPYGYQSAGDGGGSGAYARSVVAVLPGASYTLVVGAGGLGATPPAPFAMPGAAGETSSFAAASGELLCWAGGGYGGHDANDGHGGLADLHAQIHREGRSGAHGFGITPGAGGKSVLGSLEPIAALAGGSGGVGQINASGANGSPGYAILLW